MKGKARGQAGRTKQEEEGSIGGQQAYRHSLPKIRKLPRRPI